MHIARYVQYGHALLYKNPCSGVNDINNFVWTLLAFSYYVLTLSARCSGVKKKNFKEKHQCYPFYPKIKAPEVGSHKIYNVPSPFPTDAIYQRWRLYWHYSYWNEVINERWTTNDNENDGLLTMADAEYW